MLADRWHRTLSRFSNAVAVTEMGGGRTWTFGEIDRLADEVELSPVVAASLGRGTAQFLAAVVAAWRGGRAVLPVERGLRPPVLTGGPPGGIALLKRTAVGSGEVRMIALDAASQIAEAEMLCKTFGLNSERVGIAAISPAHSYGFGVLVLPFVLAGMPMVVPEDSLQPSVRAALDHTGRGEGVFLPGVPTTWKGWSRSGILRGLRGLAISAGSPLTPELATEVAGEGGPELINLYGTSETGAVSMTAAGQGRGEAGDVGAALAGMKMEVDGASGRLRVSGESVGIGYWGGDGADDLTPFPGRSFLTHDLAEELGEGRFRLTGFVGETINASGRKVSPRRVERAARAALGIAQVRSFAAPSRDRERNQDVALAVAEGEASAIAPAQIRARLQSHLEGWEVPRVLWHCGPEAWLESDQSAAAWRARYAARKG